MATLIELVTEDGKFFAGYYLCSPECVAADKKKLAEKHPELSITEETEDTEPDTCTSCEECDERLECNSECDDEDCEGREFWNEQRDHAHAYYYG